MIVNGLSVVMTGSLTTAVCQWPGDSLYWKSTVHGWIVCISFKGNGNGIIGERHGESFSAIERSAEVSNCDYGSVFICWQLAPTMTVTGLGAIEEKHGDNFLKVA